MSTMKFSVATLFVIFSCASTARLSTRSNLRHSINDSHRELIVAWGTGCPEVKDGNTANGNSFVLGDCKTRQNGVDLVNLRDEDDEIIRDEDWNRLVMIRTRLDPAKCMQASHNGKVKEGTWMLVYPCEPENCLQRFIFDLESPHIRLQRTDWCVAYRGINPNIYEDHMLLRDCDDVNYEWSSD